MIIKTYELQKLKGQDTLFFLLYGENEGFKNQVIKEYFVKNTYHKIKIILKTTCVASK